MRSFYVLHYNLNGYIEDGQYFYPIDSKSIIQPVFLESSGKKIPELFNNSIYETEIVFVSEEYDPLKKIKRGRFFKAHTQQPSRLYKAGISSTQVLSSRRFENYHDVEARKFHSYEPSRDFDIKDTNVYFRNARMFTKWRVISIEPIVGGEELYTLQEMIGIGVFPSLNELKIPPSFYSEIKREYDSLYNEVSSMPETVVDHCRDLATSLLSAKLGLLKENREDLGSLIKKIDQNYMLIRSAATIISRFHPRRKPNEQEGKNLSSLSQREAELCVLSVLQILKELEWSLD